MQNIKKGFFALVSTLLAVAPLAAGAQFSKTTSNATTSGLPSGTITQIIQQIMNWLLALIGFLGIIGFVIAGILYLTAAGDEGQLEKAKSAMIWSIVGVIVALVGFVIIKAAGTLLGGTNSTF